MNTFTTTFKVQPANGGLAVLRFHSEAKDHDTAETRNMQKLWDELDDDFSILSTTTKLEGQPHSDRLVNRRVAKKDQRAKY